MCRAIVSPDKLTASIAPAVPGTVCEVSIDQIAACLKQVGLSVGDDVMSALSARAVNGLLRLDEPIVVAEGTPPCDEVPAHLEPIVEDEPPPDEHAPVDHYHRTRVKLAHEGQPVARLVPLSPGVVGTDVFGGEIPFAIVRCPAPQLGANVRLVDETGLVVATCDGSLQFDNGHVRVEDLLHIKGNVDFSTGNIEFNGDLVVDGSVGDLFQVSARNITIHKAVEAAHVVARQALHVDGGILGKEKGHCAAGTELAARFISQATVQCDGPVTALSEISNSQVTCGGKLTLTRGSILRSHIIARGGVSTHAIGSPAELRSVVEVGVGEAPIMELAHKLDAIQEQARQVQQMRQSLEAVMQNPARLNPQQLEKVKRLLELADTQEKQFAEQTASVAASWREMLAGSRAEIEVSDRLYPGTELRFGGLEAVIIEPLRGPVKIVARDTEQGRQIVAVFVNRHATLPLATTTLPLERHLRRLMALIAPPADTEATASS